MWKVTLAIVAAMVVMSSGCFAKLKTPEEIVGVVCTKPGFSGSFILNYNILREGYSPLEGASAYIAQKDNGNDPIAGFETRTSKDGSYRIALKGLPAPTSPDGYFFLIVRKEGYEGLRESIGIGALARYMSNTVILKKTDE